MFSSGSEVLVGWLDVIGVVGALFVFTTHLMKTMIPLRIMAVATNVLFIAQGLLGMSYPTLVLHAVLLPLNAYRLHQMIHLVRKVREASRRDLSLKWLQPFMKRRRVESGEILFRKGDEASFLFYSVSGAFRLKEIGEELQPGQVVGELGMVAPDARRTLTVECVEAGDILTITYDQIRGLYFQNPEFGFYFLRLATGRLFQDIARLEEQLARRHEADNQNPDRGGEGSAARA